MGIQKFYSVEDYLKSNFDSRLFKDYEKNGIESETLAVFQEADNLGWSHEIKGVRYFKVKISANNVEGYDTDEYFTFFVNDKNQIEII